MQQVRSRWPQGVASSIAISFMLSACRFPIVGRPQLVEHQPPSIQSAAALDLEALCPPDEYHHLRCPPESPLGQAGCSEIEEAPHLLGGLVPHQPMALCLTDSPPGARSLYSIGCWFYPKDVRLLVFSDGAIRLFSSVQSLQDVYAPIESAEEALSYALLTTGLEARYEITLPATYRYFVRSIEETHVQKVAGGYRVHLFDYDFCGCRDHHTHYAVEVTIGTKGDVHVGPRQPIFEDPEMDDACVD